MRWFSSVHLQDQQSMPLEYVGLRCFISRALKFVNVTTKSRSTSMPSRKIFWIIRSTSTAVLPEPAAAATSTSCPVA